MARREREGTWKNSLLWKNAREAGAMALGHPRSCPTTGVTDLLLTRAGSRFSLSLYLPPPAQGSPPNLPDLTSILLFLCPLSQLAGASKPPGCYLSLLAACLTLSLAGNPVLLFYMVLMCMVIFSSCQIRRSCYRELYRLQTTSCWSL